MKLRSKPNRSKLTPLHVIKKAISGDVIAINTVLEHYEGYITKLCTQQLYDEYGNPHMVVDNDMREFLRTKLITKILDFKIRKIA
jgi:hypothetical protein